MRIKIMDKTEKIQKRELKLSEVEIRELDDGKRVIEGMIPYNQRSEWMGWYEYITPSAFTKTLNDGADVRAFMNHDTNKLLGRVKNNSLRLRTDEFGLHVECELPDTEYARDVFELIKGGYNTGMSFGFQTVKDRWEDKEEDGRVVPVCYLLEVRLFEVSFCVSFPAYEGTTSGTRNIRSILDEIRNYDLTTLTDDERKEYESTIRELVSKPDANDPTSAEKLTEAEKRFDTQLDNLLVSLKNKE